MINSDHEYHQSELHKYCRVCAKKIKGHKHKCSSSDSLLEPFGVDVANDNIEIHPLYYCHSCHGIAKRLESGKAGTESILQGYIWSVHVEGHCEVCNTLSPLRKGGRPKKDTKKRGRPTKESNKGIANAIIRNAPKSWRASQPLCLPRFLPPATNLSLADFQCVLCHCIVDQPVETPCRKLICATCISERVRGADLSDMPCPCCKLSHKITSSTFPPASEVVLKVLEALLLNCDKPLCTAVVGLKHLKDHVDSGCQNVATTFSPSKLTIGQILSRPLQSPPTVVEQKAAANVVQRLMRTSCAPATQTSSSPVVKLSTDGTVSSNCTHTLITCTYMHTCTKAYIGTFFTSH